MSDENKSRPFVKAMVALLALVLLSLLAFGNAGSALAAAPGAAQASQAQGKKIVSASCDEIVVVQENAPDDLEGTSVDLAVTGPSGASAQVSLTFGRYEGVNARWTGRIPGGLGVGSYTLAAPAGSAEVINTLTVVLDCTKTPAPPAGPPARSMRIEQITCNEIIVAWPAAPKTGLDNSTIVIAYTAPGRAFGTVTLAFTGYTNNVAMYRARVVNLPNGSFTFFGVLVVKPQKITFTCQPAQAAVPPTATPTPTPRPPTPTPIPPTATPTPTPVPPTVTPTPFPPTVAPLVPTPTPAAPRSQIDVYVATSLKQLSLATCSGVFVVLPNALPGLENTVINVNVIGPKASATLTLGFIGYKDGFGRWSGPLPNLGNGVYTFYGALEVSVAVVLNCAPGEAVVTPQAVLGAVATPLPPTPSTQIVTVPAGLPATGEGGSGQADMILVFALGLGLVGLAIASPFIWKWVRRKA